MIMVNSYLKGLIKVRFTTSICFFWPIKSVLLGMKCVFKHQYLKMFGLKKTDLMHCQQLKFVGRDSITQLQHV